MNKIIEEKCKYCEHFNNKLNLLDKCTKNGYLKWCAISRDLLYLFPQNKPKIVFIEGYGYYEVRDVMNKRHRHRIDLLINPSNSLKIKVKNVKIKIIL